MFFIIVTCKFELCLKIWNSYELISWLSFFSWQPEQKYKFSFVKLPPKPNSNREFVEGQEVEVFAKFQEQEPNGWYKAIVKVSYKFSSFLHNIPARP